MRPVRLIVALTFILITITFLLLLPKSSRARSTTNSTKPVSGIRSFFSFHSPLFPLSAIISLTDDNSTFFLSRPAAFGPLLPDNGLSGQLWIGRGFGEDPLGRVGVDAVPEGELGCSDVPGWDEGFISRLSSSIVDSKKKPKKTGKKEPRDEKEYKDSADDKDRAKDSDDHDSQESKVKFDDGTDDHLHQPLVDAANSVTGVPGTTSDEHADIQSLQETAEIGGKVVLLSRGGCGFMEKVKWAQKRGAMAVVVGDNIPGGPLLTMYAQGDTSNVTIPALFTSYTTAHLLSSLIPSGGHLGTLPVISHPDGKKGYTSDPSPDDRNTESTTDKPDSKRTGWFRSLLDCVGLGSRKDRTNRSPSDGGSDWIVARDWDEDLPKSPKKKNSAEKKDQKTGGSDSDDNFVIGVHDWRNPDLSKKPTKEESDSRGESATKLDKSKARKFRGGVAAPESGQYAKPDSSTTKKTSSKKPTPNQKHTDSQSSESSWLFGGKGQDKPAVKPDSKHHSPFEIKANPEQPKAEEASVHEGLWVTLTPTTMSSSPFIDTLLVLVVSPLVTLTLVYTLLLIRSRIRRRRWRAPKSVVDRLPVRTYHTIPSGASTTSLATPLPGTSTVNTPLLQSTVLSRTGGRSPRSLSRHRPRSFTTSEVLDQVGQSSTPQQSPDSADAASLTESEKREKGLAEWRRRYGGRQRECVVCLEEYIDGVSQVMSLPCGHEFHADCITPWLTTRRRTCPICKGDVVRSLARAERPDRLDSLRPPGSTDNDSDIEDIDQPLLGSSQDDLPEEDEDDDPERNGIGRNWTNRNWWQNYWTSWHEWMTDRGRDRDSDPDRNR